MRLNLLHVFQIFGAELRDEETEVWFVDIAYDDIPERHYKESEVSRGESVGPGAAKGQSHVHTYTHPTQRKMENWFKKKEQTEEAEWGGQMCVISHCQLVFLSFFFFLTTSWPSASSV